MSNNRIENSICEAIQIIADKTVAHAGFDKTIRANIVQVTDATTGEYKVKYQDSEFTARAADTGINYQPDAQVLVLIPGNDWSRPKTILNGVNLPASNYKQVPSNNNVYNVNGPDLIKDSVNVGLCSYRPDTIVLYECDYQEGEFIPNENNKISINQKQAQRYVRGSNDLLLSANFKTLLDDAQFPGEYGLIYTLVFYDNVNKEFKEYQYMLSNQDVEGNPYLLNRGALVTKLERDVDNQNFVYIKKIQAFVYGFPYFDEDKPDDIFISNININGADALNSEQLSNNILVIQIPDGDILPLEEGGNSLRLIANIKTKGVSINRQTQDVKYYWFIENGLIFASSKKYNGYAGEGWQCLNPIYENAASSTKKSYIAGRDLYTLTLTTQIVEDQNQFIVNVPNKVNKILCVAVYGNDILKKQITIINTNAKNVYIDNSDKQPNGQNKQKYYLDNGNPTLTCQIEDYKEDLSGVTYQWTLADKNNKITQLDCTSQVYQNFPIKLIKNSGRVICTAIEGNQYIGTGSINLINSLEIEGNYTVQIINGTQIFKYNIDGISPANQSLDRPLKILPLSISMIDNTGKQITYDQIKNNGKIKWYVPRYNKRNTMIKATMQVDPAREEQFDVYQNLDENLFTFTIDDIYDNKKDANYIKLEIYYKDLFFEVYTTFTFAKDGDPGTNGTEYIARIRSTSDRIYYNKNNPDLGLFDDNNRGVTLTPQLWHNGQLIPFDSVEWEILKNKNDTSFLNINKYNGIVSPSMDWINYSIQNKFPCSIIRAKISYNDKIYYAEYPIVLIEAPNNIFVKLVPYSGFKYAVYTSDGRTPDYDDTLPFEIIVTKVEEGIFQDIKITDVVWAYNGVEDSPAYINGQSNNSPDFPINKRIIRPEEEFNGQAFNHGIKCLVNGEYWIWIPIYKLLNRYGISALNDWDGNSIDINNQDGHILAPQIGAGKKNDDNNTFTGVFMGEVKTNDKTETGFMGYHQGGRTIFLDAETGKAEFGKSGGGRIILDPTDDTAKILSGNYSDTKEPKGGMLIDFTTPQIKFGTGNFSVDKDGHLIAKGGGQIAGWHFDDNQFYSQDNQGNRKVYIRSSNYGTEQGQKPYAFYSNGTFSVTPDGLLHSTAGDIGGWDINTDSLSKNNVGMNSNPNALNGKAFFAGDNKDKFYVTHNGYLKSVSGNIAGWDIAEQTITNENTNTGMNSNPNNATYVVDGHNAKAFFASNKFFVTHDGYLESTSGKIGGWTIGSTTLSSNNLIMDSSGNVHSNGYSAPSSSSNGTGWAIQGNGTAIFAQGKIGNVTIANGGLEGDGWHIYKGDMRLPGLQYVSSGSGSGSGGYLTTNSNLGGSFSIPSSKMIVDQQTIEQFVYDRIATKFLISESMKAKFITYYSGLEVENGEIKITGDAGSSYGAASAWLPIIVQSHWRHTGLRGTLTFSDESQLVFENGILIGVKVGSDGTWQQGVS